MKAVVEKLASVGAVVSAAACPVCFPKLALVGAFLGLGAFGAFESQLFVAAQVLVVVAVVGQGLSFLRHRNVWLLAAAIASGAAVFAGLYWARSEALMYAGFAGLIVTSATEFWNRLRTHAHP